MQIARTLPDLRRACAVLRRQRGSLALVPTMGAMHAGHRALVTEAVASAAAVVVSIFVNPLQFGPHEDLSRYPRDEAGDLALLQQAGCELVWMPDTATMYPPGDATTIEVAGPALRWEGEQRPGHFRGVATVVARLFGQARPDTAYFGEKDWQQLQVVRRMVDDLLLPVRLVPVPIVRDTSGVALSSRNRFLSTEECAKAPLLHRALQRAASGVQGGDLDEVGQARAELEAAGFGIEYFDLVDASTLEPLDAIGQPCARQPWRILAAARLGMVRLLDNVGAP